MAVRFDTASERLYRTANLPTLAGPWTFCLWHYKVINAVYGGVCCPFSSTATPAFNTPSQVLSYSGGGDTLALFDNNVLKANGSVLTNGVWVPIWMVRGVVANRTDVYFNRGSTPDIQGTTTFSGSALSGVCVGGIGTEVVNQRTAALKWWSAALTWDEMMLESTTYMPWRLANLEGWYPLIDAVVATNTTDYSGLGRALTSAGTLTLEDGPPIAWARRPRMLHVVVPPLAPPTTLTALTHTKTFSASGGTSPAIDTTGASLLVAFVGYSTAVTVSDSKGNTWVLGTAVVSGAPSCRFFYVANPIVGTGHTFSTSGASSFATLCVASFAGISVTPFQADIGSTVGSAGVTSVSPGSLTPDTAPALLVAGLTPYGTGMSAGTTAITLGYTILESQDYTAGTALGASLAYLIQPTPAAANPTWSWTGTTQVLTAQAAFRGAPTSPPRPSVIVSSLAVARAGHF